MPDLDELLTGAYLTGGYVVLYSRDNHRNDRQGIRYAGDLSGHADFHDLRLDLPEAGKNAPLSGLGRNKDAGRAAERIDDVADATPDKLGKISGSVTGPYLSGKKAIAVPANRRVGVGQVLTGVAGVVDGHRVVL